MVIILCVLVIGSVAQAQQGPPGRWWHSPQVVQELNLTDSEIRSLEQAFNESRLKMIQLKSDVEVEQHKLQMLLEKPKLDEAAVREQNRRLERARTALANERTSFIVEVRKIIGPARFQQLLDMRGSGKGRRN
jgi:Spy/CpxP family protein refolding chaperone